MRLLAGDRDRAADIREGVVAKVALRERHASRFGIEEAQQQVGDGGLPGSAGADERDALTRREPQADAIQGGIGLARVAGAHVRRARP